MMGNQVMMTVIHTLSSFASLRISVPGESDPSLRSG